MTVLLHDYSGGSGRCHRCGLARQHGVDMPCELPEEIEDDPQSTVPEDGEPR